MAILNIPQNLSDEHHAWHVIGMHPQFPTRSNPLGSPGSGIEFLTFHRYYNGKFHSWYDFQPNVNLSLVMPWVQIPNEMKTSQLGWNSNFASQEDRIVNNRNSFSSDDELGIFIENGIHNNWMHGAAAAHFNEPVLATFHSPQSSYFYQLHGLIDRWWWLWQNRSTNVGVGDHFYTTSAAERDNAIANVGYTDEGTACYVFNSQAQGTTPLFRLLNPNNGDHFYTTSAAERDNAIANISYIYEGIACYVFGWFVQDTTPLYRMLKII